MDKNYIIAIQTTLIITMSGFYVTGYQDLVTKQDLFELSPYRHDEPMIKAHITESTETLKEVKQAIQILNERMTKELHQLDKRIDRQENKT